MIKINHASPGQDNKAKVKPRKKMPKVGKGENTFAVELQSNILYEIEGSIDELLNDLKEQEKKFLSQQSLYELNIYKSLIKTILKTIADKAFETKTIRKNSVKGKEHTIVEMINSKLLEITNEITKANKAFDLMKSIEEIRGLILDLVY